IASPISRAAGSRYGSSHGAQLLTATVWRVDANTRVTKRASASTERVGTITTRLLRGGKPTSTNRANFFRVAYVVRCLHHRLRSKWKPHACGGKTRSRSRDREDDAVSSV